MITNQEIFDVAWQAFVVEGRPASTMENGDCMYRGPAGQRCAIGLCIHDDQYNPDMEMQSPLDLDGHFGLEFESPCFAAHAQSDLHDAIQDQLGRPERNDVVRNLYLEFAQRWDLEVPETA